MSDVLPERNTVEQELHRQDRWGGAMTISEQQRVTLSVEEAAERLGVSRSLIWKMVNQGTIRTVRAGHRVLVPVSAVEEFLSASGS